MLTKNNTYKINKDVFFFITPLHHYYYLNGRNYLPLDS